MCESNGNRCDDPYCQECMIRYGSVYDADERREEIANAVWLKLSRLEDRLDQIVAMLNGRLN